MPTASGPNARPRAALVFNPAAGPGGRDLAELEALLGERFDVHTLSTCEKEDADVCARRALERAPDIIIAAGGDGTVSLVASAVVGTTTPLGIIARGTSNSIAAGLGIPLDDVGAIATIVGGQVRLVDTARANGRLMLLHASVGFHAATVAGTPREEKNRWGVLAYIKEGLVNLADLEQFHVELETDSEVVRCRAVNLTAANVAPRKTVLAQGAGVVAPDDGALDVTIVAATGFAEAVATGLHLFRSATRGDPATRDNVGFLSSRRIRVETDPPQPVIIDGESAGTGRLEIECVPQSLSLLVPEDAAPPPARASDEKLAGLPELDVEPKA